MRFDRVSDIPGDTQLAKLHRRRQHVAKAAASSMLQGKNPAPLIKRRHSISTTARLFRVPKRYCEKTLEPLRGSTHLIDLTKSAKATQRTSREGFSLVYPVEVEGGLCGVQLRVSSVIAREAAGDPAPLPPVSWASAGLTHPDLFILESFLEAHSDVDSLSLLDENGALCADVPPAAAPGFCKILQRYPRIIQVEGLECLFERSLSQPAPLAPPGISEATCPHFRDYLATLHPVLHGTPVPMPTLQPSKHQPLTPLLPPTEASVGHPGTALPGGLGGSQGVVGPLGVSTPPTPPLGGGRVTPVGLGGSGLGEPGRAAPSHLISVRAALQNNFSAWAQEESRRQAEEMKAQYSEWLRAKQQGRVQLTCDEAAGRDTLLSAQKQSSEALKRAFQREARDIAATLRKRAQDAADIAVQGRLAEEEQAHRRVIAYEALFKRCISVTLQAELLRRLHTRALEAAGLASIVKLCKRSWGDAKSHEIHRVRREKAERLQAWEAFLESQREVETLYAEEFAGIEALQKQNWACIERVEEQRASFYRQESVERGLLDQAEQMGFESFLEARREINKRIERDAQVVLEKLVKAESHTRAGIRECRAREVNVLMELLKLSNHVASVSVRLADLSRATHAVRSAPPRAVFVDLSADSVRHYLPDNGHLSSAPLFPFTRFQLGLDDSWGSEYNAVRKEEEMTKHLVPGAQSIVGRELEVLCAKHEWIASTGYECPLPILAQQYADYEWLERKDVLRQMKLRIGTFTAVIQSMALSDYQKQEAGLNRTVEALVQCGKKHRRRLDPPTSRLQRVVRRSGQSGSFMHTLDPLQSPQALSREGSIASEAASAGPNSPRQAEEEAVGGNTGGSNNVFLLVSDSEPPVEGQEEAAHVGGAGPSRQKLAEVREEPSSPRGGERSLKPKSAQVRLIEKLFYKGDEVQYNASHEGWVLHISGSNPTAVLRDVYYECWTTSREMPRFEVNRFRILKATVSADAGEATATAWLPKPVLLTPSRLRVMEKKGVACPFGGEACELFRTTYLNGAVRQRNDNTVWEAILESNRKPDASKQATPGVADSLAVATAIATLMKPRKSIGEKHAPQQVLHFLCELPSPILDEGLLFVPHKEMDFDVASGNVMFMDDVVANVSNAEEVTSSLQSSASIAIYTEDTNIAISLLKCIVFDSKAAMPVLGLREVVVTVTDHYGPSTSSHFVDMTHEDQPTVFAVPDTRLSYHTTPATAVAPEHVPYLPPGNTMLPVLLNCKVSDPDTDRFSGGFASVSILSGAGANDTFAIVPNNGIDKQGDNIYYKGALIGRMNTYTPENSLMKKARALKVFKSGSRRPPVQKNTAVTSVPPQANTGRRATPPTAPRLPSGPSERGKFCFNRVRYLSIALLFIRVLSKGLLSRAYRGLCLNFGDYVEVSAAQAFLRCVHFTAVGVAHLNGSRQVEVKLHLGNSVIRVLGPQSLEVEERISDFPSPTFLKELVIKVAPPLLSVVGTKASSTAATPSIRYHEGNGNVRITSFDVDESIQSWDGGFIKVHIANSFIDEDSLTVFEKDGIKLSSYTAPKPTDPNTLNGAPGKSPGNAPLNNVPPPSQFVPLSDTVGAPTIVEPEPTTAPRDNADPPASSIEAEGQGVPDEAEEEEDEEEGRDDDDDADPCGEDPAQPAPAGALLEGGGEGSAGKASSSARSSSKKKMFRTINRIKGKLKEKVHDRISAQNMLASILEEGRLGIKDASIQTSRRSISIDGRFVGLLEMSEKDSVKIRLAKADVKRKDILILLRNIGYKNRSNCPQTIPRVVCFTVGDGGNYSGSMLVCVEVVEVDNITSVVLETPIMSYRGVADENVSPFMIAPLHSGFIQDPDTEWFDKGHLAVELFSGGHKGDSFRILTKAQQEQQIETTKKKKLSINSHLFLHDPGECLFEVKTDRSLVLCSTGKTFGTVSYPKPKGFGGRCIHIQFKGKERIVSRELFTFVLNSIAYQNVGYSEKNGKEIPSNFTVRVSDGVNPTEGKKRFTINLAAPLVNLPGFSSVLTAKPNEVMQLWSQLIVNVPASTSLERGKVTVNVTSETEGELGFDMHQLHGMVLRDFGLYQGASLLAVVPEATASTIEIDIGLSCKCTQFQLQTTLRAITFRPLHPGGARVELSCTLGKRGEKGRLVTCATKIVCR